MDLKIKWSPEAVEDVESIAAYIKSNEMISLLLPLSTGNNYLTQFPNGLFEKLELLTSKTDPTPPFNQQL